MYNKLEYIQNEGPVYLWRLKTTGEYRVTTPNSINTFKTINEALDVYRYYVPVYRDMMENKEEWI